MLDVPTYITDAFIQLCIDAYFNLVLANGVYKVYLVK